MPVVVWVHGGGFVQGRDTWTEIDLPGPGSSTAAVRESLVKGTGLDTMFNMTKYAQDGILAVSINYRLGMFGFMNTFDEIENLPIGGNYGLMDIQVMVDMPCSLDYGRKTISVEARF